jgi:predicted nuclease with TOPRIM domain
VLDGKPMSFFGYWLVPRTDLDEMQCRLAVVLDLLGTLYGKVDDMADEIAALKAAQAKLGENFGRLASEVREMAAKLGSVQDLSEVAVVATQLGDLATGIEALRAEVDTDGSNAPAPVEPA